MNQSINNSVLTQGGLQIIKASGDYFCAQCILQFENDKEYKVHYKSELHMYNIKRRMLDLIPATPEQFEMKKKQIIDQQKKVSSQSKNGAQTQEDDFKCIPCNKSFTSQNTFRAHLVSKKHKDTEKIYEQRKQNTSETSSVAPKQPTVSTDKDQTVCLFCDKKSADISKNLEHMNKTHSFFISEEKYCVDVQGLLKHLGQKINITYLCIQCENKGCKQFITGESVKNHMVDKGHCFMQTTVFDEYAEFYDFTPQIEEAIEYQKTLKLNNLNEKVIEIVQNKRENDEDDDCEEWESDIDSNNESDYEDADDDEESAAPSSKPASKPKNVIKEEDEEEEIELEKKPKKNKKNLDEEWEDDSEEESAQQKEAKKKEKIKQMNKYRVHRIKIAKATVNERGELELPNGKTLGHRSLRHIYSQYYRPISNYASRMKSILGDEGYRQRQLVLASQNFQIQLMQKYNAIKSHKEEKNLLAYQMHRNKVHYVNLGISHNKLQHYFRDANPL